jgi:hypothetical protein
MDGSVGALNLDKILDGSRKSHPDMRQYSHLIYVRDGVLTWNRIGIESRDEHGNPVFHEYDLDPIMVWENAVKDQPAPDPYLHAFLAGYSACSDHLMAHLAGEDHPNVVFSGRSRDRLR